MSKERTELIFMAKLAEQAERYEEMRDSMKTVVKSGVGLTIEERNLLSVAYKNVIGVKRASWRIFSCMEAKEADSSKENTKLLSLIKDYRIVVENELRVICEDIIDLLKNMLLHSTADNDYEPRVFYHKMAGDYHRYLSEFLQEDSRKTATADALEQYKMASDLAMEHMKPSNPIRLGLALNFSVFYYEILDSRDRACRLAKSAFDEALSDLEDLPEDSYKDASLIMQLLRDNLSLWTSDFKNGTEKGDEVQVEDLDQ